MGLRVIVMQYVFDTQLAYEQHTEGHKEQVKPTSKYSVEDLLERATQCLEQFQFELACKFCERALESQPQSLQALETYAPILLELGDVEKAHDCFQQLIKLSPDTGHEKYMYLGQMCGGADAVGYFKKGIDILKVELQQSSSGASSVNQLNHSREISRAYCSLAEIYLTDCCFDDNAAELCESYCRSAIEYDTKNAEAYQLLASCLLSQDQTDNAKEYMQKSIALWLPACKDIENDNEDIEQAGEILDRLLQEDDEVVQVWYLLGWLHYLENDTVAARQHLEMAQKLSEKFQCDDSKVNEHIQELLQEIPDHDVVADRDLESEDDEHPMEMDDSPVGDTA
ncbi:uncharacterized protein TRIADDRAFT_54918 [Trichoplax adhaerens]|uniref:Uncharacterized protein n=1 Tax=Trichoplax adhaerens TaxID=10228 RepID=B3RTC9_TRIAD|nr:hypothetical protein TRIADDRAFT_54918 [Trichoplax adhaerens]EDV26673.1 hypothetical protein TRIADDRAFT_54918 [Trichoplax adhaerens]|eukprot:XP_002110669.1 hypothetical protein TRIADDRAFT_54918 [Trichoplax adhaerens]